MMTIRIILLIMCMSMFVTDLHADTTTGLVGWWKLDETSGTSAFDSSGGGHTATITNGPQSLTGCPRNNCFSFVGASSQYIEY